jgi:hypothetical protein
MERFSSSLTYRQNKLVRLSLASLSSLVQYLQVSLPSSGALERWALALLPNIILGWKGLLVTNGVAYSSSSLSVKEKKFDEIDCGCQPHKTFFSATDVL